MENCLVVVLKLEPGRDLDKVSALAWSPDDRLLACGFHSGQVMLFDLADGRPLWSVSCSPQLVKSLAWSPDAQRLAVGFGFANGDLRLLASSNGEEKGGWAAHTEQIGALAFLADGSLLSASTDGSLAHWEGEMERTRWQVGGGLATLAVSPNGQLVACGAAGLKGAMVVYRLGEPAEVRRSDSKEEVRWVDWLDDQTVAFAACAKNVTYRIQPLAGKEKKLVLKGHQRPVYHVAAGGGCLITASTTTDDAIYRVWDRGSGAPLATHTEARAAQGCTALGTAHGSRRLAFAAGAGWQLYITDF